jgi:DNA-binding beta-propeller fold protein YncE
VIANNIAYVSSTNGSYITEFDATTGAVLNKYFISEASVPSLGYAADPEGLLYSNNILYVANYGANAVSTFDATTGALLNANFAPGVQEPWSLAIRGKDLFVANWRGGTVGEYDATTGAPINATLLTGLNRPEGLAVTPAPEPASAALLAVGAAMALGCRRRRG